VRAAQIAGVTYIAYVSTSIADAIMYGRATAGGSVTARLASVALHGGLLELSIVLAVATVIYALLLAVSLYTITREVNAGIALFAMGCRFVEAMANAAPAAARLGILRIATSISSTAGDGASEVAQASLLFQAPSLVMAVSSTIFALGSAIFAFLLLRGRRIPSWLAAIGMASSLLPLPMFLLRAMRLVSASAVWYSNVPLITFELAFAAWLLVKGVRQPVAAAHTS